MNTKYTLINDQRSSLVFEGTRRQSLITIGTCSLAATPAKVAYFSKLTPTSWPLSLNSTSKGVWSRITASVVGPLFRLPLLVLGVDVSTFSWQLIVSLTFSSRVAATKNACCYFFGSFFSFFIWLSNENFIFR